MNYITLSEFLADTEAVIDTTIEVEELTNISTEKGNVVLISENTYVALMQMIANRKHIYKVDNFDHT